MQSGCEHTGQSQGGLWVTQGTDRGCVEAKNCGVAEILKDHSEEGRFCEGEAVENLQILLFLLCEGEFRDIQILPWKRLSPKKKRQHKGEGDCAGLFW